MARYFTVMNGLRGCYMPDSVAEIKCNTRRELKAYIESEAAYLRDNYNGLSKRDVASLATLAWRESNKTFASAYPFVIGYGNGRDRSFGIHVSVSRRADYLAYQAEID